MGLNIYKPGQGYWTRVLTAVGLGIIFIAGAAWAWNQVVRLPIPNKAWTLSVSNVAGEPAAGQRLVLFDARDAGARVGEATILNADIGRGFINIENVVMRDALPVSGVQRVESDPAGFRAVAGRVTGVPIFEVRYLQAGIAAVIILLGAFLIYWLTATKPTSNEFFIAVDNEMHKVNWSSRREVVGSTWVVIAVCLSITIVLFVVDIGFSAFFRWIGVIDVD
ncbi:MAG: preprotein translocase subunit SecE [Phycisphaerales bacterium]|nr:MAG: preprotein translocase subunit SecE [Phycisphaerales bacterium]